MRGFRAVRVKFTRPGKSAMPELHEIKGKPHWHWQCLIISMKLGASRQTCGGLTLVELLVVVAVLVFLFAMFLPASGNGRKSKKINCTNNLKQIGLAYRIWAEDNNGKYPMEL